MFLLKKIVMQTSIFITVLLMLTISSAIARNVEIKTTTTDGKVQTQHIKLKEQTDSSLRLIIPKEKIDKNVKYLDVLTTDATANKGENGYWVLADGRMGLFNKDNGYLYERRNPMPLFGVKKGDSAFVAIVKKLKYEFAMIVDVKDGKYTIYPRFLIREMGSVYEDLVIDFHYFKGKDANYSSMGKAYRKYQLDRGEVKPLRERIKTQPTLAYTIDSIFFRVKLGLKNYKQKLEHLTPENKYPMIVVNTFDDYMKFVKELKHIGVGEVESCFVGWNIEGFEGQLPDLFPSDPAFGGDEKLKEAITLTKSLGYQVVFHVCNTLWFSNAKRFSFDDIAKLPNGTPKYGSCLAGGRSYNACFKQINEKIIDDDIKGMLAFGAKGTHHIDVTTAITPYPCFDPRHPCTRQQTAYYMNEVGKKCRKAFGGFGSEGSCDHTANSLDFALYVWADPEWLGRKHDLTHRLVPIWQIAYHGIILSNPHYATIDYTYVGDPHRSWEPYNAIMDKNTRRLKMAEFNGRPIFYFTNYKKFGLNPIKEAYDEYKPMRYLQYEFIDFHDEIKQDIFITKFSNGEFIVTNYSNSDFTFKNKIIKAKDYKLYKNKGE